MNINRHCIQYVAAQNFQLNTALGTTPELRMENMAGGIINIPTGSSITSLTWYAAVIQSDTPGSPNSAAQVFLPAHNSAGTATTQTVAGGNSYQIPVELFGAASLKCVVNVAGVVEICLKS